MCVFDFCSFFCVCMDVFDVGVDLSANFGTGKLVGLSIMSGIATVEVSLGSGGAIFILR